MLEEKARETFLTHINSKGPQILERSKSHTISFFHIDRIENCHYNRKTKVGMEKTRQAKKELKTIGAKLP